MQVSVSIQRRYWSTSWNSRCRKGNNLNVSELGTIGTTSDDYYDATSDTEKLVIERTVMAYTKFTSSGSSIGCPLTGPHRHWGTLPVQPGVRGDGVYRRAVLLRRERPPDIFHSHSVDGTAAYSSPRKQNRPPDPSRCSVIWLWPDNFGRKPRIGCSIHRSRDRCVE